MSFGYGLNKYREDLKLSVNKLGDLANISPTYISRLQKDSSNRPTKKTFFKILYALFVQANKLDYNTNTLISRMIKYFITGEEKIDLTSDEIKECEKIIDEFIEYVEKNQNELIQKTTKLQNQLYENKFIQNKNGKLRMTENIKETGRLLKDKPIFDIEWYLKQNEFEILIPRTHISNKGYESIDYNILNAEDKSILLNLFKTYIETKYKESKVDKDFYYKMFKNFVDNYHKKTLILESNKDKE